MFSWAPRQLLNVRSCSSFFFASFLLFSLPEGQQESVKLRMRCYNIKCPHGTQVCDKVTTLNEEQFGQKTEKKEGIRRGWILTELFSEIREELGPPPPPAELSLGIQGSGLVAGQSQAWCPHNESKLSGEAAQWKLVQAIRESLK